jgi:hypothetical protein
MILVILNKNQVLSIFRFIIFIRLSMFYLLSTIFILTIVIALLFPLSIQMDIGLKSHIYFIALNPSRIIISARELDHITLTVAEISPIYPLKNNLSSIYPCLRIPQLLHLRS